MDKSEQSWFIEANKEIFGSIHFLIFLLMFGALDELGLIEYKGGKTKLLNKDISIQMILN